MRTNISRVATFALSESGPAAPLAASYGHGERTGRGDGLVLGVHLRTLRAACNSPTAKFPPRGVVNDLMLSIYTTLNQFGAWS